MAAARATQWPSAEERAALDIVVGQTLGRFGSQVRRDELQQDLLIALWKSGSQRARSAAAARPFVPAMQTCKSAVVDHLRKHLVRDQRKPQAKFRLRVICWHTLMPQGLIGQRDERTPQDLVSEQQQLARALRLLRPHEMQALLAVLRHDTVDEAAAAIGLSRKAIWFAMNAATQRLLKQHAPC